MTSEEIKEARSEMSGILGIPLVDFNDSTDFPSSKKFSKRVGKVQRRTFKKLNRLFKKYYADEYRECRKKNGIRWWEFWK